VVSTSWIFWQQTLTLAAKLKGNPFDSLRIVCSKMRRVNAGLGKYITIP
jgi:hypothetical protein